jgi:hypothetical protein
MPKYLLLKHYRGGPEPHHAFPPMDLVKAHDSDLRLIPLRLARRLPEHRDRPPLIVLELLAQARDQDAQAGN